MGIEGTRSIDTSPRMNKLKFFCSNGGMILPRPCDGRLKYVGGETRVISAPRTVFFSDLMRKINTMFDGEFVLKYQIGPEELDALVSVKSNEDLRYMFDEYDRLERSGTSKLRTFLFPSKQTLIECHSPTSSTPLQSLEQRYVDALNGIVRSSLTNTHNHFSSAKHPISTSRLKSMCSSPSECTSPCSLSPHSIAHASSINADSVAFINSLHGKLNSMARVHSSPSLCTLANPNHESHHLVYPGTYQSNHHHQQQQQQQMSNYNHLGRGHEHNHDAQPWMSPVREDYGRVPSINNHPPPTGGPSSAHCRPFHKGGSGGHGRWAHLGQYASSAYNGGLQRGASIQNESRGIIWE